jgi:hypothetical protein
MERIQIVQIIRARCGILNIEYEYISIAENWNWPVEVPVPAVPDTNSTLRRFPESKSEVKVKGLKGDRAPPSSDCSSLLPSFIISDVLPMTWSPDIQSWIFYKSTTSLSSFLSFSRLPLTSLLSSLIVSWFSCYSRAFWSSELISSEKFKGTRERELGDFRLERKEKDSSSVKNYVWSLLLQITAIS